MARRIGGTGDVAEWPLHAVAAAAPGSAAPPRLNDRLGCFASERSFFIQSGEQFAPRLPDPHVGRALVCFRAGAATVQAERDLARR